MADTKQATPDENRLRILAEHLAVEVWNEWHGPLAEPPQGHTACVDSITGMLKRMPLEVLALASRSGPDRTPDTIEYWKSRATTAELKVLTFHEEIAKLRSGPDRTTPEEKLVIQPQLADVMKDLDYRGIHWDAELAEEGTGWEVAAEPEPQYFETLREALDFFVSLKEPQADLDRTTPDLSKLLPATFFADRDLAFRIERMVTAWQRAIVINQLQAGPDRGQQDAPDYKDELHHAIYCRDAECLICFKIRGRFIAENVEAKAAREGQAHKGDRIKVEREPGCKCEYAIWTNAKGCPVHDVPDPVQAQKE